MNKDSIAAELRPVASISESSHLSIADFKKRGGRVAITTIQRHFGSWPAALKYAGLDHLFSGSLPTKQGLIFRNQIRSEEELLGMLRALAEKLGKSELTLAEAEQHSEIRLGSIQRRFGSWPNALRAAGLRQAALGKRYTHEQCFENLLTIWTHHARPPTYKEMSRPPSKMGGKAYVKRFGTWNRALASFVERVNADAERLPPIERTAGTLSAARSVPQNEQPSRSSNDEDRREIRLGLRFAILQRDRFRCVACGASPATRPGCVLHVDHVVPFSKGGKTLADDLRTLCAECNVGRGNRFED